MNLTQLRYFVAIVDAGLSVTLAAERVHASQPGVSKQIRQLEEELGLQLFVRRGRSLEGLTPAGCRVLEHARRILAEAANIRSYAANERGIHAGRLLLATTHTQARYVLPPVLAAVKRDFPEVDIDLQAAADGEVLQKLEQAGADLALVSTAGPVPAGHPLASLDRVPALAELAAYPLISYESSMREDSSLRRAFAQQGLSPRIAMTAREANLIKTYVRAGLGAGLLAEMAVDGDDGDLRVLQAPAEIPECITWAVLPRGRVPRAYTLALVQGLAPQIDRRDLRRVLEGNLEPGWPAPPAWRELAAALAAAA